MKRVVITGIGAFTPLGESFNLSWDGLISGRSGIRPIAGFDASDLPWKMAGEVAETAPRVSAKERLRLDPFVQYAVASAVMAEEDGGLSSLPRSYLDACGVIMGSSRGGITSLERALAAHQAKPKKRMSAYLMPSTTIGMAAAAVSLRIGAKGHCMGISNACASGANAVGEAFRLLRSGYTGPIIAGGSDAAVCRFSVEGYGAMGALSRRADASASRPFDLQRDGFVLSEGSCVLMLEEREHALSRGADIHAEIIGYATSADAFHQTRPHSGGEARCIAAALADAGVSPEDVSCITAHATGTVMGDAAECAALEKVFGKGMGNTQVAALKSMTGHMLAASGAFEAAATAKALKEGVTLPTINLERKDPRCPVNTSPDACRASLQIGISNSFGFGGVNSVIVLKRHS